MNKLCKLAAYFLVTVIIATINVVIADSSGLPWMTGPLFSAGGTVSPLGGYDIQYFLTRTNTQSTPSKQSLSNTLMLQNGCYKNLQCEITLIQYPYKKTHDTSYEGSGLGDTSLSLKYQLLTQNDKLSKPNLAIQVSQTLPTGKYKNLNNAIETTGEGAYKTRIQLAASRMWHLSGVHYFHAILDVAYRFKTHANVSGINVYTPNPIPPGESYKVNIGSAFIVYTGFEYSLTKHWVPALDILYTNNSKDNVIHHPLITLAPNSNLSLAPAIEYNFNENWGIIAGVYFDVYKKNTPNFRALMISLNYYKA